MSDSSPAPESAPALTLAEKVAAAMAEAATVTKSGHNKQQNYKFASAEAILAAVRVPLLARGVILLPTVLDWQDVEIESGSGTKGTLATVTLAFQFTDGHEDLSVEWKGQGQDYGDKAYGKAYTNAVKTFVRTAWLLPTEHDDPEGSSPGERVSAATAPAPAWARDTDRIEELRDALAPRIGLEKARGLVNGLKGITGGIVPDIVVAYTKALAATPSVRTESEPEPDGLDPDAPEPEPEAEATAAVAEPIPGRGDWKLRGEGDPDPDPANGPDPNVEAHFTGPIENTKPGPGTVRVDPSTLPSGVASRTRKLKDLGCTCGSPYAAQQALEGGDELAAPGDVDDSCPIHGLPL